MNNVISTDVDQIMLDNRTLTISTDINSHMADEVMKCLLAFDDEGHKPIMLYINSPGGEVVAGLQIIDTMNSIKSDVITINTGMCASMGAVILSSGAKRMALPHSRVMIHQVSAGTQGKVFDMRAAFEETERINKVTMGILAENCGKTYEELIKLTPVDKWMDAEASLKFGIIDEITGNAHRTPMKEAA